MNICSDCIGEVFIKNEVARIGAKATCSVCGRPGMPTITHEELGERIHEVIDKHFQMTSPEPEGYDYYLAREGLWEQPGEPVIDVIQNVALIDEAPAQAILEYLADTYNDFGKDALVDPQPYDDDSYYEERGIDSYELVENWAIFKAEIASRSRYFNKNAVAMLDHIFAGIAAYESGDEKSIVRIFSPDDADAVFYRSRIAKSLAEVEKMLSELPASLAPPDSRLARAGRMNATGIGVFYGALERETCVAEVRPPVGSWVVTGTFIPVKPLRVLDLGRLGNVLRQGSIFDNEHIEALTRLQFLRQLADEISAPVMPGDEHSKYLSTQVVAEYLASESNLKIDGLIFASSQVSGAGNNITLFNRASVVEDGDLPEEADVSAHIIRGHPDDNEAEFVIFEEVIEAEGMDENDPPKFPFLDYISDPQPLGQLPEIEPSLKLDVDRIFVSRILGVRYETDDTDVRRSRTVRRQGEAPEF